MVSNRRVLFLYKLEINRIERIYRFKRGTGIYFPEIMDAEGIRAESESLLLRQQPGLFHRL